MLFLQRHIILYFITSCNIRVFNSDRSFLQEYLNLNYCFRNLKKCKEFILQWKLIYIKANFANASFLNVRARVKHDKYLTVHTSNQSHFSSAFIAPINLM